MHSARKRLLAGTLATLSFGLTALLAPSGAGAAVAPPLGYDAATDFGSLFNIERIIGAQDLWAAGYTGKGVDVALVDTGVSPVAGLSDPGKIVYGPDVSIDSGNPDLRYLDSYGHGTHMAGIIAGRDAIDAPCTTCTNASPYSNPQRFYGVAPDARIVSVKAGATDGGVDVSQVIAAINWVVDHRNDNGLRIRVLNLSFGTDAVQSYQVDPLAFAVERAWDAGIVVVVAAGNDGLAVPQLANPAYDPDIIAVGADDPNGTLDVRDDFVPDFAQHGNAMRPVDVIAPATHVLSLRVPGSFIDLNYPGGVVGDRFLRGSGTSQASAVTAGLAALLVQKFPTATPDQIKAYLKKSAQPIQSTSTTYGLLDSYSITGLNGSTANQYWYGSGVVNGRDAVKTAALQKAIQYNLPATGLGSLDAARGTGSLLVDGKALTGEVDVFGRPWTPFVSRSLGVTGQWDGSRWTGSRWTAGGWTGSRWTGSRWTGGTWSGSRWTGSRWTGSRWTGGAWS
jgi:serine protease AprX